MGRDNPANLDGRAKPRASGRNGWWSEVPAALMLGTRFRFVNTRLRPSGSNIGHHLIRLEYVMLICLRMLSFQTITGWLVMKTKVLRYLLLSLITALLSAFWLGCGDDDEASPFDAALLDVADVQSDVADVAFDLPEVDVTVDSTGDAQTDAATSIDSDGDGLSDDVESNELGTNPEDVDTDADGYWDGWEVTAGTNPLDEDDFPDLDLPQGPPYNMEITAFTQPAGLEEIFGNLIGRIPPVLVFCDGLTDGVSDVPTRFVGGLGEAIDPGDDDAWGSSDDVFALDIGSWSQLDGSFFLDLSGHVIDQGAYGSEELMTVDLTGVSELTRGLSLTLHDAELTGTFSTDLFVFTDGRVTGTLLEDDVRALLESPLLPIPLNPDTFWAQMDPDGDGEGTFEFEFSGYRVTAADFVVGEDDRDPEPREPGSCCPDGVVLGNGTAERPGTSIEAFLNTEDQGVQPDEETLAQRSISALLGDPQVALVATSRVDSDTGERSYFVYTSGGTTVFSRSRVVDADSGTTTTEYQIDPLLSEGTDILERGDYLMHGTYESALTAGTNPSGTTYPGQYDTVEDERLSFIPEDDIHYPYGYERLAALLDDPRAGDLLVERVSWASGCCGHHGSLSSTQSRSAFALFGPGIYNSESAFPESGEFVVEPLPGDTDRSTLFYNGSARAVDLAPTIAAAIGVAPTQGIGPDGRFRDDVLLGWQDGNVLFEIFQDGTGILADPPAQHAVIIVNDGLNSNELIFEALNEAYLVEGYRMIMERGLVFRHGLITNFPSNTYPSHNVLGSGAYSGHHGLLGNRWYNRELADFSMPITDIFSTERLFGSAHANMPVETLFEAIHRTFGAFNPDSGADGILTASLNDPSTRGATVATFERRYPDAFVVPQGSDEVVVGETVFTLPEVDMTDAEGLADNADVLNFAELYLNPDLPIPRYTILNLAYTDGGGHRYGPHGDEMREFVLPDTAERVRVLLEILREAGVLEETVVVLTSDHGMELGDASRSGSATNSLTDAGVRFTSTGPHIYFITMDVVVNPSGVTAGTEATLDLTVADSDTGQPIAEATIDVVSGAEPATAVTDSEGDATLHLVVADSATSVELIITADRYNDRTAVIDVE